MNKSLYNFIAFLICKVLIKRVESVGKSYYLQVPKINHNDTTLDKFGKVYVKYDDYHFYPELIISYSPK